MSVFRQVTALISVCFFLLFHCMVNVNNGNGSGVGNGLVIGKLFEPKGIAPAEGASVVVRYKNYTASIATSGNTQKDEPLYTTLTDSNGIFSIDTLPDGLYVIEGCDDKGNMVLYDSVLINNPETTLTLPDDTLEPSGVITGTVVLGKGGNHQQVFVLAFGVDRFCQVQTDGHFYFPRFAGGRYTLKILSLDLAYETVDTSDVVVISGDTTDIGEITLPQRNLQSVPTSVQVAYDSLGGMQTTISWSPTPGRITAGYNIYRQIITKGQVDSLPLRLNYDKLYKDTSFSDNFDSRYELRPWRGDSVLYWVTMIDMSGNESRSSVHVVVPVNATWEFFDSIVLNNQDKPYYLARNKFLNSICPIGDSYIVFRRNVLRALYRFSASGLLTWNWTFDDFAARSLEQGPVIKGSSSDGVWFLLNFYRDNHDSVFVYHLPSSGELTRQFRIEPEAGMATDKGGVIIDGSLYYLVGSNRINKLDMEKGVYSPFLDLDNGRIVNIISDFNNGFVVNVEKEVILSSDSHSTTIELTYEYIFFDGDGNRIKTITPTMLVNNDKSKQLGLLIAADKTTLYFYDYYFLLNTNGSYNCYRMPYCKSFRNFKYNKTVREDGVVLVMSGLGRRDVLCFYRLTEL